MTEPVFDPKGLIREAFAIAGIDAAQCRSIFLDWALSVPTEYDTHAEVARLVAHYAAIAPADHPMLATLHAAMVPAEVPRRRGGRGARIN